MSLVDPFAMRVALLQAWSNAVGAERISPPELQAVGAVLRGASAGAIPTLLRGLYREPVTAKALKLGDVTAISEALRWRGWRDNHLPDALWARRLEDARLMREPVWQAAQHSGEPEELPRTVLTVEGELPFEEDYLPRVIAGEHLYAAPEAEMCTCHRGADVRSAGDARSSNAREEHSYRE